MNTDFQKIHVDADALATVLRREVLRPEIRRTTGATNQKEKIPSDAAAQILSPAIRAEVDDFEKENGRAPTEKHISDRFEAHLERLPVGPIGINTINASPLSEDIKFLLRVAHAATALRPENQIAGPGPLTETSTIEIASTAIKNWFETLFNDIERITTQYVSEGWDKEEALDTAYEETTQGMRGHSLRDFAEYLFRGTPGSMKEFRESGRGKEILAELENLGPSTEEFELSDSNGNARVEFRLLGFFTSVSIDSETQAADALTIEI